MSNTTSIRRVNAKEVTVLTQLFRNLTQLFKDNDLQGCMQVCNPGDGRHSMAKKFIEMTYGPVPDNFEDIWNEYPNGDNCDAVLFSYVDKAKAISDLVKLVRTACRGKARGTLSLRDEQRVLNDIQGVIEMLTEFTA